MTVGKFLAALVFAGMTAMASFLTDEQITHVEWASVAIAVTGAAGVWIAANVPTMDWAKTAVAVVAAALNVVHSAIMGGSGITTSEWINIGLAGLGVLAVYFVPNQGTPAQPAH